MNHSLKRGPSVILRHCVLATLLVGGLSGCQRMAQPLPPTPIFDSGEPLREPIAPSFSAVPTHADMLGFAGSTKIYFEGDSAELSVEAKATLDSQAQWLISHPSVSARLEGHADQFGTREYRFALAARRAAAMKFHLLAMGIAPERLVTISFGKQRPAAGGLDENSRKLDNRGETVLIAP